MTMRCGTTYACHREECTRSVLGGLLVVRVKTFVEALPAFFGEEVDDRIVEGVDDEAIGCFSVSEWLHNVVDYRETYACSSHPGHQPP